MPYSALPENTSPESFSMMRLNFISLQEWKKNFKLIVLHLSPAAADMDVQLASGSCEGGSYSWGSPRIGTLGRSWDWRLCGITGDFLVPEERSDTRRYCNAYFYCFTPSL